MSAAHLLLLGVAAVWAALEGGTVLVAAAAGLPRGPERLDRLGWGFLLTEAWTLVALGLVHGVLPAAVHQVYTALPWAPACFVAGWMLRDMGLWFRRRPGATGVWNLAVAVGGISQGVGVIALAWTAAALAPQPALGGGAGLLVILAPPVLLVGALLQWWWHATRRSATGRRITEPSTSHTTSDNGPTHGWARVRPEGVAASCSIRRESCPRSRIAPE